MFPLQLYLWKSGNADQKEQKKELKNCLEHLKGAEANLTLRLQNEQVPSISRGAAGGVVVSKVLSAVLCYIV